MKKLVKWGGGVGLLLPAFACRQHGFKPGSEVRVIVLEREIRIRHASLPREDEYTPFEQVSENAVGEEPW
jgi:antitoxin component of MazEF toxin-antitoxin module